MFRTGEKDVSEKHGVSRPVVPESAAFPPRSKAQTHTGRGTSPYFRRALCFCGEHRRFPDARRNPTKKGPGRLRAPASTRVEKNYAMALLTMAAKLSATREAPPTSAPSTSSFSRKPAMFSGLAEPP